MSLPSPAGATASAGMPRWKALLLAEVRPLSRFGGTRKKHPPCASPVQRWAWVCTLGWALLLTEATAGENPPFPTLGPGEPFSFVVLGDNRGDDTGAQPPVFRSILRAVRELKPRLVLNTGDMIFGFTSDESRAREQWRSYREAIREAGVPFFHVPGNHDLWDEASARLYRELWGPTYYAFDYGPARFIGLDTETEPSRLGPTQWAWLRRQLEEAGQRLVFIFLHRPLFPVDGAIGSSMDAAPAERDQLHRLFVSHSQLIKGVFLGHEHLYHFRVRDGVPYYITGGGGANLYMPPELGGFHHFLLVRVAGGEVTVELKKDGPPREPLQAATRVAPGALLESWEQGLFWYTWDYTVRLETTGARATEGRRALEVSFDAAQCPWPVLVLPLPSQIGLRDWEAFTMDVHVPDALKGELLLAASVEGARKHQAPPVALKTGWNTVRTDLTGSWLPREDRKAARAFGWCLTANAQNSRCSVLFDRFSAQRGGRPKTAAPELIEGWERPLFWRVADESVQAEITSRFATEGASGLSLRYDFARCGRPVVLARLNPPWDLTGVTALSADVYLPEDASGSLSVALGFRAWEAEAPAPPVPLKRGWNKVSVALHESWLPRDTRRAVEQVECTLMASDQALRGWVVFDNLRAAGPAPASSQASPLPQ